MDKAVKCTQHDIKSTKSTNSKLGRHLKKCECVLGVYLLSMNYKSFLQFRRHLTPSPHIISLSCSRASPGVFSSVCDTNCKNYFSHLSFSYLHTFFSNSRKLKLGVQQIGGKLLLIASHLDQSNYLTNQSRQTQAAINQ